MTTIEPPAAECWLSSDVRVAPSSIEGQGLVATQRILAGTPIARLGGQLVTDDELRDLFDNAAEGDYVDTVSIDEAVNLVLPPGEPLHAGNHGCDPSMWWSDPYTLVARRDIATGEELTLDYATITDDTNYWLDCRCGAQACRGSVTGRDWQLPALQHAYAEHWVPVLRRRIAALAGG